CGRGDSDCGRGRGRDREAPVGNATAPIAEDAGRGPVGRRGCYFNNLLSVIVGHSELLEMRLRYGDQALEAVTEIGRAAERATSLTRQLLAFSRQQVVEPRVLDLNAAVSVAEKMLGRIIGEDVQLITSLQTKLNLVGA